MTLISMNNRYLYMFGGLEHDFELKQAKEEIIQRLDTFSIGS